MSAHRIGVTVLAAVGALCAGEACAQQTVRELMDAGGRMAAPAELRALLGLGPAQPGVPAAPGSAPRASIDEAGRGCVDGDCRYYWRTADGRWLVSTSPDTAAPLSPRRAP